MKDYSNEKYDFTQPRYKIEEDLSRIYTEKRECFWIFKEKPIRSIARKVFLDEDGSAFRLDFINGIVEYFVSANLGTDKSYHLRHRDDGPAVIRPNGDKYYIIYDYLHRDNAPAMELADGTKKYFWKGLTHRSNGPAVILPDGTEEFWFYGQQTIESMLPRLNTIVNFM